VQESKGMVKKGRLHFSDLIIGRIYLVEVMDTWIKSKRFTKWTCLSFIIKQRKG